MAQTNLCEANNYIAASNINPQTIVTLASGITNQVVTASGPLARPLGVTVATSLQGEAVAVYQTGNTVKVTAAASLGNGGEIGLSTASKSVGPVASGAYRIGLARENAAAGQTFSLYVDPDYIAV